MELIPIIYTSLLVVIAFATITIVVSYIISRYRSTINGKEKYNNGTQQDELLKTEIFQKVRPLNTETVFAGNKSQENSSKKITGEKINSSSVLKNDNTNQNKNRVKIVKSLVNSHAKNNMTSQDKSDLSKNADLLNKYSDNGNEDFHSPNTDDK